MCVFTSDIESVKDTRIFARQEGERQVIVYEMYLSAKDETAMVLPIPVGNSTNPEQVEFINLSDYSMFFHDIESLFPKLLSPDFEGVFSLSDDLIEVQQVGVYEASFVPTPKDFERLDPRFSLNENFFEQAPEYSGYGFVVFKLKPGESRVHPMAFWFSKNNDNQLFFPTKHMHDGVVHSNDNFSHTLYAQGDISDSSGLEVSDISDQEASDGIFRLATLKSISKDSLGVVANDQIIYKKIMHGENENKDVWLSME